ncbi:MAG: hypothetical protein POG74_12545, partial [Acidocella sp.]|nr:hypothetical protein [Acidocella sp.]
FMVTGNDTGQAVLQGLGLTQLTTTSHGPLTWFEGASPHGPISICFKPAALGARNIYLSDLAPQSPRAEMATA